MTPAEKVLWEYLRKNRGFSDRFKRQFSIKGFVLDFYCPKKKLCIEVDGGVHLSKEQQCYDKERTKILNGLGVRVLRFTNEEVFYRIGYALNYIHRTISCKE
jgi:very-short-patch-repair endonuclease